MRTKEKEKQERKKENTKMTVKKNEKRRSTRRTSGGKGEGAVYLLELLDEGRRHVFIVLVEDSEQAAIVREDVQPRPTHIEHMLYIKIERIKKREENRKCK